MSAIISAKEKNPIWKVIGASSVGTLIEWYDFYIFGSLAPIIAAQFFPKSDPTAALLATLATFAAGFIVRPFGALVFGRLGDLVGRKYTFLVTLILMGGSTFAIGLVPGYEKIGFAAPIIILLLRLIQGLALGGEYGGAATYVAEHAPRRKEAIIPAGYRPQLHSDCCCPWASSSARATASTGIRCCLFKNSRTGAGEYPFCYRYCW
jgi:MFS family permease